MNEPQKLTSGRVKTDQQASGMAEPAGRWAVAGKASCTAYVAPAPLLAEAGAEPDIKNGDADAGDLTVHQQAGEAALSAGP